MIKSKSPNSRASSVLADENAEPSRKKTKLTISRNPSKDKIVNYEPPADFCRYDFYGEDFDQESATSIPNSGQEETVGAFSIHRLKVDKLKARFQNRNIQTEEDIIDEIMRQVNARHGYTKQPFEKRLSCFSPNSSANSAESGFGSQNSSYGFQTIVYVQKLYYTDKFLELLNIQENHVRINKIIFYHKPLEIFGVTVGSAWQAIQYFSCYDFPYEISGRLTSTEGTVQETLKPLTGNVRSCKTTKKNASIFDQLNNIRYNVVKEVRLDSSLYWLKEFSWGEDKTVTKIRFGLAYIRIEKCMKPENIPEILNLLSQICKNEKTVTFPDMQEEKHFDDLPMIRPVPPHEYQLASEHLCKLMYGYMHNHQQQSSRVNDLEFSHKNVEDFAMAEDFKVKYENGHGVSYIVHTFTRCPNPTALFAVLREKCSQLTIADYVKFKTRITNCVKLVFSLEGKTYERKVWDLIECEVSLNEHGDYCKILGQWCTIRDEYHFEVHKKFLELLRKDNVLLYAGETGYLPFAWNAATIKSVAFYTQTCGRMTGYYVPPKSCKDMFDLLYISPSDEQSHEPSLYLYYIFDRFDAGIHDSSTRILKSLDALLLRDGSNQSLGSESPLLRFYASQTCDVFKFEFPTVQHFLKRLTQGKVNVVLAFVTEHWKSVNSNNERKVGAQSIDKFFPKSTTTVGSTNKSQDARIRSFYHECTLQLNFSLKNIQTFILKRLPSQNKLELWKLLRIQNSNENGFEIASKFLLERLMEKGYCTGDTEEKSVTGKLLKIRNVGDFKLFPENEMINQEIFKLVQRNFMSQFPGFIQKLECFRVHESVMQWPRINLRFTEIQTN